MSWLWIPVAAIVAVAVLEGFWLMLGALAIVVGGCLVALAAEDRIKRRR